MSETMLQFLDGVVYAIRACSTFSFIIPLILWLCIRQELERSVIVNLILALSLVSGAIDLTTFFIRISPIQNAILINSYFVIEFFLLSFIYYEMYLKNYKTTFYLSLGIYVLYQVLITIFIQPFTTLQNLSWTLSGGLFILMAIGWNIQFATTTPVWRISRYPYFWISTAVLLYFIVVLCVSNYFFTNMYGRFGRFIWSLHNLANITKNVFFALGLYYLQAKLMAGNRFKNV